MKALVLALVATLVTAISQAQEALQPPTSLKIVATHPALADIARQVGGDRVVVSSISEPTWDVHSVEAKPSVFAKLRGADVFLHSGLDLELWATDAVNGSRNAKIRPGEPGNLDVSEGILLLNVPDSPSRADGDVHIYGNPHYWMDPLNARIMAQTIASRLSGLDPAGAETYQANRRKFVDDLNERLRGWLKRAIARKNTPVVAYHDSFPYFARRFGLRVVGHLEPKPRIAPTQSHLLDLIGTMRDEDVHVVIREPFHDRSATEFIDERTGSKTVTLTTMPGGVPGSETYQDMIEADLDAILGALP